LKSGSSGKNVSALQCLLNDRNNNRALIVDGSFGPATYSAVAAFQKISGLTPDGIAGQNTLSKLVANLTVKNGAVSSAAKAAQYLLSKFETITIDGSFGPGSASAAKISQQKLGIAADGIIGVTSWQYLFGYAAYPPANSGAAPQSGGSVVGDVTKYNNTIHNTPLLYPSKGLTYCNVFAQNVMKACGAPLPTGSCSAMFSSLRNGHSNWKPLAAYAIGGSRAVGDAAYVSAFQTAQANANAGIPTLALTAWSQNALSTDHASVVTPNGGAIPATVGKVFVCTSGGANVCFYDKTLEYSWSTKWWPYMMFYSYL